MQREQNPNPQQSKRKTWIVAAGIIFAFICLCVGVIGVFSFYFDFQQNQYVGKPTPVPEKVYLDLRASALNTKASELGLEANENTNQPYGIVMDWNIGNGTATLISFATGDASLYYSTGGGSLGGVGVEEIHDAAIEFVNLSEKYVDKLSITSEYPMPPVGYVRFYILTPQGVYGSDDIDDDSLTKDGIDFRLLFSAAQNVISEFRKVQQ